MLAYHNDPAIKAKYIARVRAHRLADELIQGTGFEDGKGCAVGCTLDGYNHSRYPIELGVPLHLAHLEDALFELLEVKSAMEWPERFLAAIRPGSDLSGVWAQWAIWSLTDPTHGVIRHAAGFPDVEAAILEVADCWRSGAAPGRFARAARAAEAAWAAARAAEAAWAAAEAARAAWAAARAAWAAAEVVEAAEAAWAAAEVVEAAARAAWAAASAVARAAEAAWVKDACAKLIELLEAAARMPANAGP